MQNEIEEHWGSSEKFSSRSKVWTEAEGWTEVSIGRKRGGLWPEASKQKGVALRRPEKGENLVYSLVCVREFSTAGVESERWGRGRWGWKKEAGAKWWRALAGFDWSQVQWEYNGMMWSLVSVQPGDTSRTWSELHFRKTALDLHGAVENGRDWGKGERKPEAETPLHGCIPNSQHGHPINANIGGQGGQR